MGCPKKLPLVLEGFIITLSYELSMNVEGMLKLFWPQLSNERWNFVTSAKVAREIGLKNGFKGP